MKIPPKGETKESGGKQMYDCIALEVSINRPKDEIKYIMYYESKDDQQYFIELLYPETKTIEA